jgi:aconitase A
MRDSYRTFDTLPTADGDVGTYSLPKLGAAMGVTLDRMPVSLKVLLENLVRHEDGVTVTEDDIAALARWPDPVALGEVSFHPVRVLMPDSSAADRSRRHARRHGGARPRSAAHRSGHPNRAGDRSFRAC